MTTRPVSAQGNYPFVPEVSAVFEDAVAGILDVHIVVQGDPSAYVSGSSSSPETTCQPVYQEALLTQYVAGVSTTEFIFTLQQDERLWEVIFEVPHSTGAIGQVVNSDSTECYGVLIFDSSKIPSSGAGVPELTVEPGCVLWYTEQVDSVQFKNIWRCHGIEDPSTVLDVALFEASGSSDISLSLVDGYNCELSLENSSSLTILLNPGGGLGRIPDDGDTGEGCSSSNAPAALEDVITTINGLAPSSGDIDVDVSRGLGLSRETGQLTISVRPG